MNNPVVETSTFSYDGNSKSAKVTPAALLGDSKDSAVVYYSLGSTKYDKTTPPSIKNVSESSTVYYKIVDTKGNYIKKYKMNGEINESNILEFIKDWENKRIKPYVKSSEEPKENNGDVFIVVGNTFEKEVINNNKDVVVLFYSPICYHCKALLPKYEEVAKRLKSKNLILSKIDAFYNEVESIENYGFPKIKLYPGNKKDKPPIDYNGDKSVEDIIKFIKNNAAYPINDLKDKNTEL